MMVIQGEHCTIHKVDIEDIDRIYNVYKNCEDFLSLGPIATASKEMVLDDLNISKNEGGIYCGIFLQGEMVGVIDFVLSHFESDPRHAYISLLMISVNDRCHGIGKDAVRAVEAEILKNTSINTIYAGVQTNNVKAITFWERMGYKIVSEPQLMPDTTITYKLQKDII